MRPPEVPVAASGLLRDFASAGMLHPVDYHLARRMAQLSGESSEAAELAFALACRQLRLGSVCIDIRQAHQLTPETALDDGLQGEEVQPLPWPETEGWLELLAQSPAVATGGQDSAPFQLAGSLLYLQRWFNEEQQVADALRRRSRLPARPAQRRDASPGAGSGLDPTNAQHLAIQAALTNATTVITGGPGTGKTTTVARILQGLRDEGDPPLVALTAPTGKAATQLESSVMSQLGQADGLRITSSTLHKLLDIVPGREKRTYGPKNPLPHHVVIVDETSMVSLTLMSWLLEAVSDRTRLILIGDPDQLESVEAGAVLSDIADSTELVTSPGGDAIVRLEHNWRSNQQINQLSAAVRGGDSESALELLGGGGACQLFEFTGNQSVGQFPELVEVLLDVARDVQTAALAGDGRAANEALNRHRLLCAHREGPFGVSRWSEGTRAWLSEQLTGYGTGASWAGQPLLMTRNSDVLSNGDTGVVVRVGDRLVACMDRAGDLLWRDPLALDGVADLHAMTIHKSQGSQFGSVSVILPPPGSPLLTRQLLYTAITRAQERVQLYGTAEAFEEAVNTPAFRASGLSRL